MRKAQFFYLLRRGLLSGGLNLIKEGLVMASKFTTQGLSFPAQGSAEFNGTSDYIQLNESFSHTNHTIAAWINTADASNIGFIFDNRDANDDGIRLLDYLNGSIRYSINANDLDSNYTLTANDWVYLSATYDGSTMKLYVDGSVDNSLSLSGASISVTTNAKIGDGTYENFKFDGNLANVAIWNRALSSDEINSVMWKSYEGLTGTESNGLQAWYSLDDITSPAASLATMQQLATDKNATIENTAAITAAINSLS